MWLCPFSSSLFCLFFSFPSIVFTLFIFVFCIPVSLLFIPFYFSFYTRNSSSSSSSSSVPPPARICFAYMWHNGYQKLSTQVGSRSFDKTGVKLTRVVVCIDPDQIDERFVPDNILRCELSQHQKNKKVDVAPCSRDVVGTSWVVYHYHNFHISSVVRQIDRCVARPQSGSIYLYLKNSTCLRLQVLITVPRQQLWDRSSSFFPNVWGAWSVHWKLLLENATRSF